MEPQQPFTLNEDERNELTALMKKTDAENKEQAEIMEVMTPDVIENKIEKGVRYKMAQYVTKKLNVKTLIESEPNAIMYRFNGGVYRPDAVGEIKRMCYHLAKKDITTHDMTEILGHIRGLSYVRDSDFDKEFDLICVKNGILNIKTRELMPHTPENLMRVMLPIYYDPAATCPRWNSFIREVVIKEGDKETEQHKKIMATLQEITGYCLYRDTPIHKAIMLTGEGGNGKSVYLLTLLKLFGVDNVSSVPLQSFDTKEYCLSAMVGKLANIHADLSDKSLTESSNFKIITSGDNVYVNIKYLQPITTKIYAKQLFSANKIPKCEDNSDAFFRRWLIINFPNKFDDTKADKMLPKKLEAELSGILNWALEGLNRLLENGHFSYNPSNDELSKQYLYLSDPVAAFVSECLVQDVQAIVTKDDMYNRFISYCKERRTPLMHENVFAKQLILAANPIRRVRPTIGQVRQTAWEGWNIIQSEEAVVSDVVMEAALRSGDLKTSS